MKIFQSIGVIRNKSEFDELLLNKFEEGINELRKKATWSKQDILDLYYILLPDFDHKETGKYLDQRM